MRMNLSLAVLIFLTSGSVLLFTTPAKAALIGKSIQVEITTGSLSGRHFFGSLFYDDSSLTGVGFEWIGDGNGFFEMEFDWLGSVFTEASNPGFTSRAEFEDGVFVGMRYFLGWDAASPNFYVMRKKFLYESTPNRIDGLGTVKYVGAPSVLSLCIAGLVVFLRVRAMRSCPPL